MDKKKRAELSMQIVVIAIIALLVLVVMIFVFRDQIGNITKGYKKAGDQANTDICVSFLSGGSRQCSSDLPGDDWVKVDDPKDGWKDCDESCYEKIS